MVPEGVTVVSALHRSARRPSPTSTPSSARTSSSAATRSADKAPVARLIERIDGLRAVNAGPLEMARIAEQMTPLLISVNVRYKAHAGLAPGRAAGHRSLGVNVVALAGGTGGAKLAAGIQEVVGAGPHGDRQHRRRHRDARRPRLPRPRPLHLLAQRSDRRGARLGDPRRRVHRLRAARRARRPGLVRALRPRPRDLPRAPAPARRRRAPDRRSASGLARALGARGDGAADVRRAGPDPGADRRPDGATSRST